MNWNDLVAPLIRLGAPLIGQALGGPLGAAAGKIVAETFGASEVSPAAVERAISTVDPERAAQLAQAAEDKWLTALADIGKAQVAEIGETMRAESASGDPLQRWWRPLYALELSLLECPAFVLVLLRALWIGHDAGIAGFGSLSPLLMAYFGARFGVLGVYVTGRTREKQCAVTGEALPSVLGELVKAVTKRR
ncbi:MAG TPA: 3TM-type holin [Xanthobacteraceae bacterium]|nr:3TM-type holin [Xanthobacteraceae bacterium]